MSATSATRELDELMACLSDFKVQSNVSAYLYALMITCDCMQVPLCEVRGLNVYGGKFFAVPIFKTGLLNYLDSQITPHTHP